MRRRLEFEPDDTAEVPPAPAAPDTQMSHYVALLASALLTWTTITHPKIQPGGYVFAALAAGVAQFGGEIRRGEATALRLAARWPLPTAGLLGTGALWIMVGRWPALAAGLAGAGAILGWSHLRALRFREPIEAVKVEQPKDWLDDVDDRWPAAAQRAGLVHPDDPSRVLPALGPAEDNGVGGAVLRVDPHAIDADPAQVRAQTLTLQRALHVAQLHVQEEADGGTAAAWLHMYRGYPLADPIHWRTLRRFSYLDDDGEWVPIGQTVTAEPAWWRARYSGLATGVSDSGKGGVLLAVMAGMTVVELPVALLLVDNKGADGGREWRLLAEVAAGYVQTAADCWPLVRAALDAMAWRFSKVVADGHKLEPSDRHPLVLLAVAELWDLLQSRPPATVTDWAAYTGGRLTKRPDVGEWRSMIDEALTRIAREGQAAGVAFVGCVQAAQLDAFGKGSRLRTVIPQRTVLRVLAGSDVEPALGTTRERPPAELIPETQPGTGYIRRGTGIPVLYRAAHVPPADIRRAIVQPMQRLGVGDWIQSVAPFILSP